MKIYCAYILSLFVILSGCSSSVESTAESINNVKSSRYHYIPHLDSYIIVPNNFTIKDSTGAINAETGAFLSWERKSDQYEEWIHHLDSFSRQMIEFHKESEPGLNEEKFDRTDLVINGTRASLLSCQCYYDTTPDQQLTYRLIIDRNNSIDVFVGNGDLRYRSKIEDSILFSLRSLIP